jgi:hypothetical protein
LVQVAGSAGRRTQNKHEAILIAQEYEAAARKAKTLRQIERTLQAVHNDRLRDSRVLE